MTVSKDMVPVKKISIKISDLEKNNLIYKKNTVTDFIDENINKGTDSIILDNRILKTKEKDYKDELYQLFRLEFSHFINKNESSNIKKRLQNIINNKKMDRIIKITNIRQIIYKLIDTDLYNKYLSLITKSNVQTGGKSNIVNIVSKVNNIEKYEINNDRQICDVNTNKNTCESNYHCKWAYSKCNIAIQENMLINFIGKISDELVNNTIASYELLQIDDYFVSDIVNYNRFTEKEGQKILKSNSSIIKNKLEELFGKDNIPIIGKRRINKKIKVTYEDLNNLNLPLQIENIIYQKVLGNNLTIFRAYVNGYYWIKNDFNEINTRNLAFYSEIQTDLSVYFRGLVINWILDNKNKIKVDINDYITSRKLFR